MPKVRVLDIAAMFEKASGHKLKQEVKTVIALPPAEKQTLYPNNNVSDTL